MSLISELYRETVRIYCFSYCFLLRSENRYSDSNYRKNTIEITPYHCFSANFQIASENYDKFEFFCGEFLKSRYFCVARTRTFACYREYFRAEVNISENSKSRWKIEERAKSIRRILISIGMHYAKRNFFLSGSQQPRSAFVTGRAAIN